MKKRVLAIILALGLAMTSFSVTGLAEETEEPAVAAEAEAEEEISSEEEEEPEAAVSMESETEEEAGEDGPLTFERPEIDLRSGGEASVRTVVDISDGPGEGGESGENGEGAGTTQEPGQVQLAEGETVYMTLEAAGAAVRDQMIARTTPIEISVSRTASDFSQYTDEQIGNLFFDILEKAYEECDNPRGGDYLRYQLSIAKSPSSYSSLTVSITYNVKYYTSSAQEEEMDSAVSAVLSQLNLSGLSEDCKIAKIYDYITSHVVYDYKNLNNPDYLLKNTAYGALINGTSVCQGYAVLFYRLCKQAGLSVRIVSGTATNSAGDNEVHAWNIVKVGELYYAMDSTWDAVQAGPAQYKYFLKSEGEMSTDHFREAEYNSTAFNAAYPMAGTSLPYPEEAKVPVTGIILDSTQGYVLYGQPYRVQATVEPADAFDTSVSMEVVEYTVGYSSSVSAQDRSIEITPTAPSDGRTGTIVVKISSVSDPEVSATCTIKTVSTAADLDIDAIQLSGNSLSLHGDIGVTFYMDMKASVANRAVIHYSTPNGGDGTVSLGDGLTVDENTGSYKFTVNMVAKEMRDVITITVKDTEGNPITLLSNSLATDYTDGYEYSIARYLELAKESTDEKLVALAEAMDNYGEYAQVYFGYNSSGVVPDSIAINNITAETVAENVSNYNKVKTGILPEGLAYYGTSLTLEAETLINHYFTVESGHNIDEYSFTAVGKDLTPVSAGSNYYRVTLEGIPAAELGTYTTTEVGLSGENSTYTIQYSGMSYVYSTLSKETVNENLGNLCKALYVYHQKAKGLFTS